MAKTAGEWTTVITGHGPHHNASLDDVDQITAKFVGELTNAGHSLSSGMVSTQHGTQRMDLGKKGVPAAAVPSIGPTQYKAPAPPPAKPPLAESIADVPPSKAPDHASVVAKPKT